MLLNRDDKELVIQKLVSHYPKCFFAEPRMRLPLKKNILGDLEGDGFPFTREEIIAVIEWYQSHVGYLRALQAGTKRIDLNGKAVGTVTQKEWDAALERLRDIKQLKQKQDATQTLSTLHAAGHITDDQLRKLDAPSMKAKNLPSTPSKTANLHEALKAAEDALNGPNPGSLQLAIRPLPLAF